MHGFDGFTSDRGTWTARASMSRRGPVGGHVGVELNDTRGIQAELPLLFVEVKEVETRGG
jgi:hypothetical protein